MSVSSLNRMTVPLSGDQSSSTQGLLMPKLAYRFRVIFENFGVSTPRSELTKQVIDVSRPQLTHEPITLDVYNSKVHLAGKHSWNDITVNLRDDATGAVARLVGEQMQRQLDHMEQASASSGIDYKFTMRVEVLDGGNGAHEPTVLETWELYGCFVTGAEYSGMAYGTNDVATVGLTVKYDNALQTPLGSGIGTDVGRTLGDVVTG